MCGFESARIRGFLVAHVLGVLFPFYFVQICDSEKTKLDQLTIPMFRNGFKTWMLNAARLFGSSSSCFCHVSSPPWDNSFDKVYKYNRMGVWLEFYELLETIQLTKDFKQSSNIANNVYLNFILAFSLNRYRFYGWKGIFHILSHNSRFVTEINKTKMTTIFFRVKELWKNCPKR